MLALILKWFISRAIFEASFDEADFLKCTQVRLELPASYAVSCIQKLVHVQY